VSRGYPASLDDKYVDCTVSVDMKRGVVGGEPQVTRPPLNILWRGSSCRLACCGGQGQYSVSAAGPAWWSGWIEPDWVVYGMRTKTGKNIAKFRARTRGR
jgi:hypothetical protein